jgi:hypothetical protein
MEQRYNEPEYESLRLPPKLSLVIWVLLILMSILVGRAAVSQNTNYIDLGKYSHLQEKRYFQGRILMAPVIRIATESRAFLRCYSVLFSKTVDTPEDLVVAAVNCASLLLLLPTVVALRRAFHPAPRSSWLAPLLTLLVLSFTYVVRYEQRFTMPYDLLSVFLFTLGLLMIIQRRGWALLLIMLVAAPNRETALFLVPVWFWMEWRERRLASALAYGLIAGAIWVAWRMEINHLLGSAMLYDFQWQQNFRTAVNPIHWPQLFSVFGFLAAPMWLLRGYVTDPKLRATWIALIPHLVAALVVGVWRETRIFGEFCPLVGITFAIQIEQVLGSKEVEA